MKRQFARCPIRRCRPRCWASRAATSRARSWPVRQRWPPPAEPVSRPRPEHIADDRTGPWSHQIQWKRSAMPLGPPAGCSETTPEDGRFPSSADPTRPSGRGSDETCRSRSGGRWRQCPYWASPAFSGTSVRSRRCSSFATGTDRRPLPAFGGNDRSVAPLRISGSLA